MKLPILMLTFFLCEFISHKNTNAQIKPPGKMIAENHQAYTLITQPVTINSYWNDANKINPELPLSVKDPECKKIDPLNYINNPESFFQSCQDVNNSNGKIYEPVEYLKVPPLDSGIRIKLGDF
jgi:hypothetical protein